MLKKNLFLVVLIGALVALAGPAFAQGTPDGETPANEGVCDVLQGGTPGLYGLCVAFCEAQDLDDVGEVGEPPRMQLLQNYTKKQQPGDPDMPCLQAPCPCWSAAELNEIVGAGQYTCQKSRDGSSILLSHDDPEKHYARTRKGQKGRNFCAYVNTHTDPITVRNFPLLRGELELCSLKEYCPATCKEACEAAFTAAQEACGMDADCYSIAKKAYINCLNACDGPTPAP